MAIELGFTRHPGAVLRDLYMKDLGVSPAKLAASIKVSPATVSRLLSGRSNVSVDMAQRLSAALGTTPDLWVNMQTQYDLFHAKQNPIDVSEIEPLVIAAE